MYREEAVLDHLSRLLEAVAPGAVTFCAEMARGIQEYGDEDLAVEYARLFVGPYELQAAPYGSVYLDQGRRVMGDSTLEVVRLYQDEGLSLDGAFKELPDHIAVELEFMSYLIYREIERCANSNVGDARADLEKQHGFLKRHLGAWAPGFATAILQNSTNRFFTNLARCTDVFIHTDADYISNALRGISLGEDGPLGIQA